MTRNPQASESRSVGARTNLYVVMILGDGRRFGVFKYSNETGRDHTGDPVAAFDTEPEAQAFAEGARHGDALAALDGVRAGEPDIEAIRKDKAVRAAFTEWECTNEKGPIEVWRTAERALIREILLASRLIPQPEEETKP